jgi:hypothetical protein
MEYDEDEH